MKRFILLTLGIHLIAGNLCLMQMAHAAMPAHSMHWEHEMVMSDGCEQCSKADSYAQPSSTQTDCTSGHCLMHAAVDGSVVQQGPGPVVATIVPSAPSGSWPSVPLSIQFRSTAPPGNSLHINTIVLRC